MFLCKKYNYDFDLKDFFKSNRRKKSQECGVLGFFTQIFLAARRETRIKQSNKLGLILAFYLCTCNKNFAFAQNLFFVRSAR